MIAETCGCPVWLLHQLSDSANDERLCRPLHHSDAAECPRFAEHLDYALIASVHREGGLFEIINSKHLRLGPPEVTVRMRGELNWVDGTGDLGGIAARRWIAQGRNSMGHPNKSATQQRKNRPRTRCGLLAIPFSFLCVSSVSSFLVFAL